MLLIKWLLVVSCWVVYAWCQQAEKLTQDPCVIKQTCHECIRTPTCAWCSQPDFKEDQKRCFQPNADAIIQCADEFVYNPDNEYRIRESKKLTKFSQSISQSEYSQTSYSTYSSNRSSTTSSSHHHADIVQIAPQVVNLKLRINEPYRIAVDYSQAQSYPVDLYYLMDLSKSMEDDKHKLSALGNILSDNMKNITTNFRLGFGSFVDKVVMPYVSVVPKKLIHPCDSCVAPYGFKNHLPLSSDTSEFSGEVEKAAVSGNLDAPEGGFDAIMQAVVCWDQIGWRDKARKLLVFSTDAGFHYAGDGKLGGIVKPNDGKCHLDRYGHYTHSTIQDYPSVSQINLKVKENSINVIFAVTSEQIDVYGRLREHIQGSSAGVLSNDSSNVVELVRDQYNKITSEVEMKDTASSAVKVSYYSNCLNPYDPVKKTTKCEGLKVDSEVRFQAEIEVKACPPNKKDWKQTFKIYPVGLNESLTVHLEMQCDCPCENKGNQGYEEHSESCSNFGTYMCGICECDDTHFGRTCECDAQNTRQDESGASCRPDNTTQIECSGRGSCICGQCQCNTRTNPSEIISGAYCECDNFSCDRVDGVLCSGPDHGVCDCGRCDCLEGWSGADCSCSTSEELCRPPGGGEICSGHGVCQCGKCVCNNEESDTLPVGRYSGKYCDKCPTCPGRCQELKECVQCQVYKTGPLTEEECATNCTFVPEVVNTIEVDESKDENLCSYTDEEDCHFTYVYSYDEKGRIVVRAKKERQCPPEVFILAIVLGVIGAIVLIGLAFLLLWKLLTTIHDRREFARFEKDTMLAKWDTVENPIYKQATSTFKNPTYAGK